MGFFKSLDAVQDIASTPIGVNFITAEYTYESFFQKIEDGSLADSQIQNRIISSKDFYFNYDNFEDVNTRSIFQSLWTSVRFLRNVKTVVETTTLDALSITTVNKIAYDYYCAFNNGDLKDSEVNDLLLSICEVVNCTVIVKLCSIMEYTAAKFISIAARSSFKPEERVHRLNDFIIHLGYDFTVKNIIYIYSLFYDDDFSTLFIYSMTGDSISIENKVSHETEQMFDRISYALIVILESMNSEEITKVLRRYSQYLSLMNYSQVRFSLRSLSADFSRVVEKIDMFTNIP